MKESNWQIKFKLNQTKHKQTLFEAEDKKRSTYIISTCLANRVNGGTFFCSFHFGLNFQNSNFN
jgi:hypothetical protein